MVDLKAIWMSHYKLWLIFHLFHGSRCSSKHDVIVRKQIKLHILCCGGWCHERWISLMAYQTQPALLAGMFIVRDILPYVFCEIWINCGYVWLRCCRIGNNCVVLFLKMWQNWCLFHYKNLVRPVRPYHWGTLTQLPVTHLLHNASGWQDPGHGRFEWQPFRQL